jgi:hypothetical protein
VWSTELDKATKTAGIKAKHNIFGQLYVQNAAQIDLAYQIR